MVPRGGKDMRPVPWKAFPALGPGCYLRPWALVEAISLLFLLALFSEL